MLIIRNSKHKDVDSLKSKGWAKIHYTNTNNKKAEVAILI